MTVGKVYANCNVIDVTDGCKVLEGKDIFVKDGRIAAVKPHGKCPDGWQTKSMNGAYAVPGLVNLHVHLFGTGMPSKVISGGSAQKAVLKMLYTPIGKFVVSRLVASAAKQQLMSGVTTLRAVGDFRNSDIELAAKLKAGKGAARGLRMFASGPAITVAGGHGAGTFALVADTPEALAALAEANIDAGADFVKICITGGVTDAKKRGEPGELKMTAEQVKAVCDVAHARGKKVAAHIQSKEGMEIAAKYGVDTVEHGALMSDNAVALFRERGGAVVATFSPALPYFKMPPEITKLGEDCAYNSEIVLNGMKDAAHQAADNGMYVGLGTDASCPFCTQYGTWRELVYFNRAGGFTPEQSLYTATLGNAKILGIGDETGSIEAGKSADIVFTEDNPVRDLTALSNVSCVVAQGREIAKPKVKRNKKIDKLLDEMTKEI